MREAGFDLVIARAQRVILGVGDLRRVLAIIKLVVMGNLRNEPLQLEGGFGFIQLSNGLRCERRSRLGFLLGLAFAHNHHAERLISRSAAARASSVMVWPASMRAISSRRCGPSSTATRVAMPSPSAPRIASLAIKRCPLATAATCGACVTASTWTRAASLASLSPTAAAVAPP